MIPKKIILYSLCFVFCIFFCNEKAFCMDSDFSKVLPHENPLLLDSLRKVGGQSTNHGYLNTNEIHTYLFEETLRSQRNLGAGLFAVGSDQNYNKMLWMNPAYTILFDADTAVVYLHLFYRIAFLESKTPGEFISLFSKERKSEALDFIDKHYGDSIVLDGVKNSYIQACDNYRTLGKKHILEKMYTHSHGFLENLENYSAVRMNYIENRVQVLLGFNNDPSFIKAAVEEFMKRRVLITRYYLSNSSEHLYIKDNLNGFLQSLGLLGKHNSEMVILGTQDFRKSIVGSLSVFQLHEEAYGVPKSEQESKLDLVSDDKWKIKNLGSESSYGTRWVYSLINVKDFYNNFMHFPAFKDKKLSAIGRIKKTCSEILINYRIAVHGL